MRRSLLVAALISGATAQSTPREQYEPILRPLWNQADTNADSELSLAEWSSAQEKLGIAPSFYSNHGGTYAGIFSYVDSDSSGGVTIEELANLVTSSDSSVTVYIDPLVSSFSNGAADEIDPEAFNEILPAADHPIMTSTSSFAVTFELDTAPSAIFPGTRTAIKEYFASTSGVSAQAVIISFLPVGGIYRQLRRLTSGSGTAVTARVYMESGTMPTFTAAEMRAAPAFSGLSVSYVATEDDAGLVSSAPLPFQTIGIVGGACAGVLLFLIINACFWSGRKAKKLPEDAKKGCCSTGCCSFNAVKSWAFGEVAAAGAIAGTVVYLYTNVTPLTDAIIAIVAEIIALFNSDVPQMQSFRSRLEVIKPILDALSENIETLRFLPFVTMGPGLVAAGFLLLGSFCPILPMNKGSYCVTKCMVILAHLTLILSLVFYAIFAGFSVALQFPIIRDNINRAGSVCITVPASLQQHIADADAALTLLGCPGTSCPTAMVNAATMLADARTISLSIDTMCTSMDNVFETLQVLFVPGLMCVVAIVFAMVVNQTLCCSAGCCRSPPKGDEETADKSPAFADKKKKGQPENLISV